METQVMCILVLDHRVQQAEAVLSQSLPVLASPSGADFIMSAGDTNDPAGKGGKAFRLW